MDLSLERAAGRPTLKQLYDDALSLKARLQLGGSRLQARQGLIAAERPEERRLCRELADRVLAVTESERRRAPALLNAAGMLAVAAGEFAAALRLFEGAAAVAPKAPDQAIARFNAYRAALELRDWPVALRSLLAAAALQPEEFSPFPLRDFQPERILGAGGTGVAFLCKRRGVPVPLVVKALAPEELGRPVVTVLAEAAELKGIAHPALVTIREWGSAGRGQPYLVTEHFEGASLDWTVQEEGPLRPAEVRSLLQQIASALAVTHRRSLLHRDLKPSNILCRRGEGGLEVRLIDFGLPLRAGPADLTDEALDRTLIGRSAAGTRAYAAPELGPGGRGAVGAAAPADIFALGRCGCLALLGTPRPAAAQWDAAPPALGAVLRACLAEAPKDRPDAARLLAELETLPDAEAPRAAAAGAAGSLLDKVQRAQAQAAQIEALRAAAERGLAALDFAGVEAALRGLLALRPDDAEAREALEHLGRRAGGRAAGGADRRGAAPSGARRRVGRPSEEEVLEVLRRYQPQEDLHVAPAIPQRKLSRARAVCALPEDEHVLGLIDCTIFGGASDVVLLTQRGLHHRNMVDDPPGPRALPYEDFPGRTFAAGEGSGWVIDLGEDQLCNVTGSDMPRDRILALLNDLRAWYPL